jgi:hypothetical protein
LRQVFEVLTARLSAGCFCYRVIAQVWVKLVRACALLEVWQPAPRAPGRNQDSARKPALPNGRMPSLLAIISGDSIG